MKLLATNRAHIRLLTSMQSCMFLVVTGIVVLLTAVVAFVKALTSVYPQMGLIVAIVLVVLTAYVANKGPFTGMQAYVTCEVSILRKLFAAELTCVRFFARVKLDVRDEITEGGASFAAHPTFGFVA